ncbi:MAG: hypothetical protein KJP25_03870 [Gammaproteobacteria bacterium]|nr:hypothetical protein [Gammaproteobacteria bacterium]MBT8151925.1 hypothetical protein [Gammaproteobacteria bacterium]NNL11225.1 hypothetical protein [Pseudomonadales bacterium]NNM10979.1 hypothetical protein [Pseudomonadales bacterium]RZV53910.1 MAG: hypothetical protein EX270_08235 [Pseudomonadales bacterium]
MQTTIKIKRLAFRDKKAVQRLSNYCIFIQYLTKASTMPENLSKNSVSGSKSASSSGSSPQRAPALEALLQHPGLWRASNTLHARNAAGNVLGTGFRQLNNLLHAGGWPIGNVVECLSPLAKIPCNSHGASQGISQGALQLFLPALQQHAPSGKPVVLVAPPHIPYLPGWPINATNDTGMPALWVVAPPDAASLLWSAEQILQSNSASAVFIWLEQSTVRQSFLQNVQAKQTRPRLNSTALRKLQLAARQSESLVVVFREAGALQQPSPAPLRLLVKPVAIARGAQAAHGAQQTKDTQLEVHIAKQPGGWGGQQTRVSWHSRLQRPVMPAANWPVYQPAGYSPHGERPGGALPLLGTRAAKWS